MGKYMLVVQSEALAGRDDEYNDWYDNQHFQDICAIPGVTGGRRLEATPLLMGEPGRKYLALYDIATDDPGAFMAEMGRRGAQGLMPVSDSLDHASVRLWIYQVSEGYA